MRNLRHKVSSETLYFTYQAQSWPVQIVAEESHAPTGFQNFRLYVGGTYPRFTQPVEPKSPLTRHARLCLQQLGPNI